jgi:glycosyltransferase involved in cell wall biosynthesis
LYKINIKKNTYVIVQQEWLRKEFEKIYGVKTIVAYPIDETYSVVEKAQVVRQKNKKFVFFYPAFPRVAKNFQVLLEASKLLAGVRDDFEVLLSINGEENKYSKSLSDRYKHIKAIRFDDRKTREQVFDLYNQIDCMVFPSKLETWGLPISEFKEFNKPILLADCKYAHETVGNHQFVKFFDPDNVNELASYMGLLIDNNLTYDYNETIIPGSPFFHNWDGLVNFLLK